MQKQKILIVDDDEDIQALIKLACSSFDLEVIQIKTMQKAIEAFEKESPVITLMDITLPGGSGLAALRKIRSMSIRKREHPKIIMVSARTSQQDQDKAIAYGADEYLTKPFNLEQIKQVIERHLE